ncbi:MAG: acyl-CoA dehydrogenase [Lachnospiraceae bacterium]|jgi:alkylation response protein AidB-like acyl-CoA dehydrogenase|nr:acyl-CoA dehydrogenase [Lachnospiraceae bacterium]MCI8957567.1 acyl-CoA dehydrogenase [Lachnospiraceae bacterium]
MNKYALTEEQLMIQEMAKKFADQVVAETVTDLDRRHAFPVEEVKQCAEMGFLGICVPEEYGGAGMDHLSDILVMEQLARHSSSLASIIDAHASLGSTPILLAGTEEQKRKFLVPAATGEALCAFALTEPQSGSDAGQIRTKAVLEGEEWVINGTKAFITNSTYASTFLVAAKTDLEAKGSRGISVFIVPAGTPGLEVGKPEEKMSNRSSYSCPLTFTDVRIPKDNLLGELNRGFPLFMKCVDSGRVAISAVAVGMAQGVLERAAKYSKERVTFGKPICENQAIAFKLAEMATEIEVARAMLYNTARLSDTGLPFSTEATMTKMFCSEMCVRICDMGLQIMGGYGLCDDYQIERMYRDAKLLTIGEGTSEICRMVVGRAVLKEY